MRRVREADAAAALDPLQAGERERGERRERERERDSERERERGVIFIGSLNHTVSDREPRYLSLYASDGIHDPYVKVGHEASPTSF